MQLSNCQLLLPAAYCLLLLPTATAYCYCLLPTAFILHLNTPGVSLYWIGFV